MMGNKDNALQRLVGKTITKVYFKEKYTTISGTGGMSALRREIKLVADDGTTVIIYSDDPVQVKVK